MLIWTEKTYYKFENMSGLKSKRELYKVRRQDNRKCRLVNVGVLSSDVYEYKIISTGYDVAFCSEPKS